MATERDTTSEARPRPLWFSVALALTGLVVGFCIPIGLVYWWLSSTPLDDRDFDRDVWVAHEGSWADDNPRGEMAHDLRDRLLERRPTYREVVNLLGEPDWPRQDPPQRIAYILGVWSWPRNAHDSLAIFFGEDGRVERVSILNSD